MEAKIHGPPKKVITPLSAFYWTTQKQGLIDRYEMLAERNEHMKFKIEENKKIMKEIKNEIRAIEGR